MLAPSQWRRVASWICGWLYVVGNITITLAVNFGTTLFFVACINVFESEPGVDGQPGVGVFAGEPYQVYLIFLGITLLCNAVSSLGNKYLPWLDVRCLPFFSSPRIAPVTGPANMLQDCYHLLDLFWFDCHRHYHPRPCQGRPP